ncbi:MAG: polysaccharide deacetylase family protein [Opitutaceae bacterium]|nr:polysaccharide deacetylase family protein [Opitutaceae bacterium]
MNPPSFSHSRLSRRGFLAASALAGGGLFLRSHGRAQEARRDLAADPDRALIAITLDMEMSRNFPQWENTHWDYEKGNLNDVTKRYCVDAAQRVKARGGVIHYFLVGQVLEHESVDWVKTIAAGGHPIGNHTYDHVYVLAKKPEDVQFRFKRSPWLIAGKTAEQAIRENITMTTRAMQERAGITPAGFRTPGGFATGLHGREDVQRMLLDLGFPWVSCFVPRTEIGPPGGAPTPEIIAGIVKAQAEAQPFTYPTGLIDIPMSPISDVAAFRTGKWKLESFMTAIRAGVEWAIEHRAVFDYLSHPSILCYVDPEFKVIDMICDLVKKAGPRAAIVDLDTIALRTKLRAARR